MSLKYGLNIKKKPAPAPIRKSVFDDEDEEDEAEAGQQGASASTVEEISTFSSSSLNQPKPPPHSTKPNPPSNRRKPEQGRPQQDLSAAYSAEAQVKKAEEVDPTIFDYDSFHDAKSHVADARKVAARQDALERKPKYINNLLDAAERRKQDQQVAREKLLQREREAEGDEFADKEKFVTSAYKQQQAETKQLQEEEKRKAEEEERRRGRGGGGMQGFYRTMLDQSERQHQEDLEAVEAAERDGGTTADGDDTHSTKPKSDAQLAAELRAKGVNVHLNEDGQVTDKRELLSAGLNVNATGRSDKSNADHLRTANRPAHSAFAGRNSASDKQAQRERQTRMMEEQLAAQAKRAREEEDEERARLETAAKSTKTSKDISDAKARYLARKAAKERGEA